MSFYEWKYEWKFEKWCNTLTLILIIRSLGDSLVANNDIFSHWYSG